MGSAGVVMIYDGDGSDDSDDLDAVLEFDVAVEERGEGEHGYLRPPKQGA